MHNRRQTQILARSAAVFLASFEGYIRTSVYVRMPDVPPLSLFWLPSWQAVTISRCAMTDTWTAPRPVPCVWFLRTFAVPISS